MIRDTFAIDLHSHILPGADHGCHSKEEFEKQISLLREAGIDAVVATPHFYPNQHSISGFLKTVDAAVANCVCDPPPVLYLGAEVLVCENMHRMPGLERLCIRGTDILLLELPFSGCPSAILHTVEKIMSQGLCVVLAHIDRYLPAYSGEIGYLLDAGAYAQINADAFSGLSGGRKLLPYLRSGKVVAFGTDLHETNARSCRAFSNLQKLPDRLFPEIMQKTYELLANAEIISPVENKP